MGMVIDNKDKDLDLRKIDIIIVYEVVLEVDMIIDDKGYDSLH